jgi:chromosome segregation ATPase
MTDLYARHDRKMDALNAQLNQLRHEVEGAEEHISDLRFRETVAQSNYQTQRMAMRNSLVSIRQLRVSQQKASIYDVRAKIELAQQKIASIQVVSLDSYAVHFESLQREITEEIELRGIAVEQAVAEERARRDPLIAKLYAQLRALETEISEQVTQSATSESPNGDFQQRISQFLERNNAEIAELTQEGKKVALYLENIRREWDSLRDSTQRIYEHRLHELEHELTEVAAKCEAEMKRINEKYKPVEDTTDFMKIVRDEIAEMEASYRTDEDNLERERLTIMASRVEEDHTRGMLQGLKQNHEELANMRETESHAKESLERAILDMKALETELAANLAEYEEDFVQKHMNEVKRYEDQLELERAALFQALSDLKAMVASAEVELAEKQAQLEELNQKIAAPENEAELIEQEVVARATFETKSREFEAEKVRLAELVENLRKKFEDAQQFESSEKERLASLTQEFNTTRESFLKSIERKRKEIEYEYQRLMDGQTRFYQKLVLSWDKDQQQARAWIQERKDELERQNSTHRKKIEQIGLETQRQILAHRNKRLEVLCIPEKELDSKLKRESDAQTALLAREKAAYIREQAALRLANRRQLASDAQQYDFECRKIAVEVAGIRSQIAAVQKELIGRLKWQCPDCDRLQVEVKDMKKQILGLVQQMHETEKEDANRQYMVAHIGKSNQVLPHLRSTDRLSETV